MPAIAGHPRHAQDTIMGLKFLPFTEAALCVVLPRSVKRQVKHELGVQSRWE